MYLVDPNPSAQQVVLLLHGLGTNSVSWKGQMDALVSAGYRPIAPDLPGFGKSTSLGVDLSGKKVVRAVFVMLEESGIRQVDLIGLSMGGVIAQKFAIAYPEMVRRILLASTFGSLRATSNRQFGYFAKRFALSMLVSPAKQAALVSNRVFPRPEHAMFAKNLTEQIGQASPVSYRSALIFLGLHNLGNQLMNFGKPALVIGGDADTTVPIDRQIDLAGQIRGARLVVVKNAGHGISVEQPDLFNREMLAWLRETVDESRLG